MLCPTLTKLAVDHVALLQLSGFFLNIDILLSAMGAYGALERYPENSPIEMYAASQGCE